MLKNNESTDGFSRNWENENTWYIRNHMFREGKSALVLLYAERLDKTLKLRDADGAKFRMCISAFSIFSLNDLKLHTRPHDKIMFKPEGGEPA